MQTYWGDIHNHCGISYGFGSLENALKAAKGQLDFCAIIGHASWYDMPERRAPLEFLVDFHTNGFAKLAGHWDQVREVVKQFNQDHEFVTFQGYEAHSSEFGDHHYVSPDDDLPLVKGKSPADIIEQLKPRRVIAVPHHVGYTPGYRGGNWESFNTSISPIVEVVSKHGCGMSVNSPFPYYHDMGPRDSKSTIYAAIARKHRMGFVGSTDHHAGYPGSYGDGRMAVVAAEKTREGIWEAIQARRTYAVSGDKIDCRFTLNGAHMGSEIAAGAEARDIRLDLTACDRIDKIVIFKNLRPWKVVTGWDMLNHPSVSGSTYKVKVEMGWGDNKAGFLWNADVKVSGGSLRSVETCFRGRSVLAPTPELKDDPELNALGNAVHSQSDSHVSWSCLTVKNPTTLHPHTGGVILEIDGDLNTRLELEANGISIATTIHELLSGNITRHKHSFNSEAVVIHPAIPVAQYAFSGSFTDSEQEDECDVYHVEVQQENGQCAWISPIYVV
ncbi:DUF3604 domain-containing protein [Paenibacillus sp. PAMC21692]|uniref:DUF3604 domain-containing protein n=1 Tax=Paenibacillus sp. PAMC21692 TaxID=2762320 RepID=UPI00164E8FBB|nr:DUF3604 domain-containing protein [Paenibacillus sp. PAMC21692]QNK58218.1 DUF3604 domain-containing protein [Paenibacillus sp. PAMC21692]